MADEMAGFVLDCSVTMAWCFADEATPYTDGIRDRLTSIPAIVPSIWPLEVANVTLVGERRNRLDESRSSRFLGLLKSLPILVDDRTSEKTFIEIVSLARQYQLSAYDAAYLELATRRHLPLTCLDRKLRAAATTAGVILFDP